MEINEQTVKSAIKLLIHGHEQNLLKTNSAEKAIVMAGTIAGLSQLWALIFDSATAKQAMADIAIEPIDLAIQGELALVAKRQNEEHRHA